MRKKAEQLNPARCKVIACATVIEEMRPLMPPEMKSQILEFGLHSDPPKLRKALQDAIDAAEPEADTILLGYGLCSQAAVGLKSDTRRLIIPKVDDCIAIFLGSAAEYSRQHQQAPGTLYMTKGWLEAGRPEDERGTMTRRFGEEKARALYKQMIRNYTRLVFINTGNYEIERYRELSKNRAKELELKYEEIKGSNAIVRRMLNGPWDGDFVVAAPGQTVTFMDFRNG